MTITREKLLKACIFAATAALPKAARRRLRLRWRTRIEAARCRAADCIVLSRAKSGRTWLRAMLSALYQRRYGLPNDLLVEFDNFHRLDSRAPRISFAHGHALGNAFEPGGHEPWPPEKPLVFLVRHPCDVAVSEYFQSTRRASAYKRELWGVDEDRPMFDFVMHGSVGLPTIVDYLNTWWPRVAAMPNALVVRYEDMRAEPVREFRRVVERIDGPVETAEVVHAVDQCRFEVMKKRERENHYRSSRLAPRDRDDPDSYKVRRAKVGGFRDYFDPEQVEAMEAYVNRHLIPELGYRTGPAGASGGESLAAIRE